ncbi:hypothetical protein [Kribbella catacumbae]|uniref:hypothetical protein n=1 Tax=Kribbella catacumbae TaxID=460086 RepID=UPI0003A86FB0|nr:hypothetical protein [Kribbella catacumbae]
MTDHDSVTPVNVTVFDTDEIAYLITALALLQPAIAVMALGWAPQVRDAVAKALALVNMTPFGLGQVNTSVRPFKVVSVQSDQNRGN